MSDKDVHEIIQGLIGCSVLAAVFFLLGVAMTTALWWVFSA